MFMTHHGFSHFSAVLTIPMAPVINNWTADVQSTETRRTAQLTECYFQKTTFCQGGLPIALWLRVWPQDSDSICSHFVAVTSWMTMGYC